MTTIKHGTKTADLPEKFAWLLRRLKAFHVLGWEFDSDGPTWPKIDREAALIGDADVVSSELVGEPNALFPQRKHVLAIDVDYPTYLVESSTEGHYHIYVDVPGGIPHDKYMRLLDALADAGVIQKGYAKVSKERGHSDLRLPWVAKARPGNDSLDFDGPAAVQL
jgi:hypothetical protein